MYQGLSPYTRGNRGVCEDVGALDGSIPVHTGKPAHLGSVPGTYWVYPRTHGETYDSAGLTRGDGGLSPYTRGNHLKTGEAALKSGSIPVHTGKPIAQRIATALTEVYPRTHGETIHPRTVHPKNKGLSPYTRGNPPDGYPGYFCLWSIPVHTGKPAAQHGRSAHCGVYPRTHGETFTP